jgi:hypothetical protein
MLNQLHVLASEEVLRAVGVIAPELETFQLRT